MKKFIFSLLVISSAVFGDNISEAEKYFESGYENAESKDYSSAIRDYTKAIKLNPNHAEAYNNRGNSYNKLKDYYSAIKDYNKVSTYPNLISKKIILQLEHEKDRRTKRRR
jgi:tetratricopeptide (TPR) repeat protein